jgi:hypothetical protein
VPPVDFQERVVESGVAGGHRGDAHRTERALSRSRGRPDLVTPTTSAEHLTGVHAERSGVDIF